MRISYLLLHDLRFAGITFEEFCGPRFHFSKEYARRMSRAGHEVTLYLLDGNRNSEARLDGFTVRAFGPSVHFPPLMKFGNSHNLAVLEEVERDAPDVVHIHNYYLWNFPYVVPWVRRRSPVVAQYHGTDPIRRLKGLAFSPSLRLCSRLLVPIESEARFLVDRLRLPAARVERFPSTGVDTSRFRRVSERSDRATLLYVGRVPTPGNYAWEKAPQYLPGLLASLRKRREAILKVAGEGPGLRQLVERAERAGVGASLEVLGQVDQEALPKLYSESWMTFVPMLMEDIEPFWGGAVQESLACGTPVVGFNNGSPGVRRAGLLVPTAAEPAAAMIDVALGDPEWIARAGSEGGQAVRTWCDWDRVVRRLDSVYRGVAR